MAALVLLLAPMVVMSLVYMLVKGMIKAPFRIIGGLFRACRTYSVPTRMCAFVLSRVIGLICRMGAFGRVALTIAFAIMAALLLLIVSAPYMEHFYGFNPWGLLLAAPRGAERLPEHYSQYSWWLLGLLTATGFATRNFWKYRYFHLQSWAKGRLESGETCLQVDLWFRFGYLFKAMFWGTLAWIVTSFINQFELLPPSNLPILPVWPLVVVAFAIVSLINLNKQTDWAQFMSSFKSDGEQASGSDNYRPASEPEAC